MDTKRKIVKTVESVIIVLLAVTAILFIVLYAREHRKIQELNAQYQKMTEENQKLQETQSNLQEELDDRKSAGEQQKQADSETNAEAESPEAESGAGEAMLSPSRSNGTDTAIDMLTQAVGTEYPENQIDAGNLAQYFCAYEIPEDVVNRITGKSYYENDNISLTDLRYLKMLYYNFDGNVLVGEMIVNAAIADDVTDIFKTLFENKYQIYSMELVDDFWAGDGEASDTNSIDHNNTSAFCYREQTGGGKLSNHAYGRAIDINPQQNPYVSFSTGSAVWSHSNADGYIDRTSGAEHMITHEDLCYQLFTEHGFGWGGDWENPKDYQHFDKAS